MSERFELPLPGPPTVVRFPAVRRSVLANGLTVCTLAQPQVPVVTAALVVLAGAAGDPADRPGLASFVADLLDEGAAGRDAIQLADAFARLGSHFDVDVTADVAVLSFTTLARSFGDTLALTADVVMRPHLAEPDLVRVRELRLSRLKQLSRSPSAVADRAFIPAVFGAHPYGHSALGTTPSLESITLDEARRFWVGQFAPSRATLIVVGDIDATVPDMIEQAFGAWHAESSAMPAGPASPSGRVDSRILVVDRPGATQSELRIGHLGPPRRTDDYHALVTLNAVLGGQFTSRINRNLRETRGITYGARTAFDMRRAGGAFACETSVQANATAEAIREVLSELRLIQTEGAVGAEELTAAKDSLTRGYVRHFETAAQLVRAISQLVIFGLEQDTFDRFVPMIEAVSPAALEVAARRYLHPDESTVVVVGDAGSIEPGLAALGREVVAIAPQF
jgi:zinc protease